MARNILLNSLSKAHLCAACPRLSRPLATFVRAGPQHVGRFCAHGPNRLSVLNAPSLPGIPRPCRGHNTYSRLLSSIPRAAAEDVTPKVPFEPTHLVDVSVSAGDALEWKGDLLLLAVFEDDLPKPPKEGTDTSAAETPTPEVDTKWLDALDVKLNGALAAIKEFGDFEGGAGSTSKIARVGAGSAIRYVAQVGLGKRKDFESGAATAFRGVAKALGPLAKANRFTNVAVSFPTISALDVPLAAKEITAQVLRSGFESTHFKGVKTKKGKDANAPKLQKVDVLVGDAKLDGSEAAAVEAGAALARGTLLASYLVDAPPNACTPTHLAEAAAYLAERHSPLKLEVLEKAQCEELGMGCYLGVAECSEQPPKFIHLTYSPPGEVKKKIAVVGKGLTFDSGGYNLKVGASMIELMKFDMGGAAATLGAANIVGALKPDNVEVHFIIASCENMVDGKGLRPGDVLTAANGKTVEVNNTDAEGRLTLADALWFAQEKCGATSIVDAATLTGACIVALGTDIAGLFSPNDTQADAVAAASKATGEKVWRMPMEAAYAESLKSSVADMQNTGGRWGGSITAALFLQEFINEGVEWAHVDMAGPVWDMKGSRPTGFGAQLLAEWAIAQSKE